MANCDTNYKPGNDTFRNDLQEPSGQVEYGPLVYLAKGSILLSPAQHLILVLLHWNEI